MPSPRTSKRTPAKRKKPAEPEGRPRSLSPRHPAIADTIIAAILGNNTPDVAAARAGIDRTTLYESLRRGRRVLDGRTPLGERVKADDRYLAAFSRRFEKACADAEIDTIERIRRSGTESTIEIRTTRKVIGTYKDEDGMPVAVWAEEETRIERPPDIKGLTWTAERRWASRWAPQNHSVLTGADGGPVQVAAEVTVASILKLAEEARQGVIDVDEIDDEFDTA